MDLLKKLSRSELSELLREYTRKFIKVLLRGEQFPGEYDLRKRSLDRVQKTYLTAYKR